MSVTQQPSYHFRPRTRAKLGDAELDELEVDVQPDRVLFKSIEENGSVQTVVLWISAICFMLFVVSVIPAMQLTLFGNALAVLIGIVVLATVGLIVQAQTRSTTIELSERGIHIDQGTVLDRELCAIKWSELASAELEPVDPKDESKGMHLEFKPVEGEPVRTLAGIGVGDLNVVRQAVLKARRGSKAI
jgi:hypothetical protein